MRILRSAYLLCLALAALAASPACAQLIELPDAPDLSPEGRQLILEFEVGGGERYYERFLARPTWPGFASGVTVGVGYDLGYNSQATIRKDWAGLSHIDRLASVAGITGTAARPKAQQLHDILIQWELANAVFNAVTVTRFYLLCERTYPGFATAHPNAQAAILSLTFNRGSSMVGPRRAEMRAIRDLLPRRDYAGIAGQLRAMKRIWRGTEIAAGMSRRREAEARLVETAGGKGS